MTRQEQKERERFWVSQLLSSLGIEDLSRFEEGDPTPDFQLEWPGHRVNVEVTQLFQPSEEGELSLQAVEGARDRLLSKGAELWSSRNGPLVEVQVHFNPSKPIHPGSVESLARQLVGVVEENLPEVDGHTRADFQWEKRDCFPEEFVSVFVIRLGVYTRSYWNGGSGGILPFLSPAHLQKAIDRKKHHRYSVAGHATWLLVVMESSRLSGDFDLSSQLPPVADMGQFDRVYLLDSLVGQAWEVNSADAA